MYKKKNKKEQLINVTQFKSGALKYFADTEKLGIEYVITKRGIPIAKIIPIAAVPKKSSANSLKELVEVHEDIVHIDSSTDWEVLTD